MKKTEMKRKGARLAAGVSACLAAVLLAAPVCSALEPVLAAETEPISTGALDYSASYSKKTEILPGELLARLLASMGSEETVGEAERAYLNTYFEENFYYTAIIPGALVTLDTDAEEVRVRAETYVCEGQNGKETRWVPVSAVYGEQVKSFAGGEPVSFPREGTDYTVTVTYGGSVELPMGEANLLLNFAYDGKEQAELASAVLSRYESDYAAWQENRDAWTDYETAREEYLREMEEYETEVARWKANREAWADYEIKYAAYEANAAEWEVHDRAMEEYKQLIGRYNEANDAYNSAVDTQNAILTSMATMESIYVKPEGTNSLYKALQSAELVSMFEKYQGVLTTYGGVSKADIAAIRASSERLNAMLGEYKEKREISQEKAFEYYKTNYVEIKTLFNTLYDKMSTILSGTIYNLMCGYIDVEYGSEMGAYKKWRIKTVLSHIYLICECLDDGATASSTWMFFNDRGDVHEYYFSDFLDQKLILTDTNEADPTALTWQTIPEKPTEPPKPTPPAHQLAEPVTPPDPWEEPQPPTEPTAPTLRLDEPAAPPEGTEEVAKRGESLMAIPLTRRNGVSGAQALSLPTLSLTAVASDVPLVYDVHGQIRTDLDPYDLPATQPEFRDETHVYTFAGWSSSPTALQPITEQTRHIYPIYTATPRLFDVIFSVNGTEYTRTFPYGSVPTFEGTPEKESDEQYHYSFSGWNPPLQSVAGEGMRYEAVFAATLRSYTVTFDLGTRTVTKAFPYGTVPTCPVAVGSYVRDNVAYTFSGEWEPPLAQVRGESAHRAIFTERTLVSPPEGTEGTLTAGATAYTYTVTGGGTELSVGTLVDYAVETGKALEVIFADGGAAVTFDAASMRSIRTENGVRLSLRRETTSAGEDVSLLLTDESGNELTAGGKIRLSFPLEGEEVAVTAYYESGLKKTVPYQLAGGVMEFWADVNATHRIVRIYTLTLAQTQNGSVSVDRVKYSVGSAITLTVLPAAEYRIGAITLKNLETGETVALTSPEGLTMPDYHAELSVEFLPLTYTVTFTYYGGSSSKPYARGEMPEIPKIETSYEADGYFYTFTGWSPAVSAVTGDAVYEAQYYSVRLEDKSDSGEGGAGNRILMRFVLPAALILVAVIGTGVTVPVVIVKRRKQRKGQAAEAVQTEEKE